MTELKPIDVLVLKKLDKNCESNSQYVIKIVKWRESDDPVFVKQNFYRLKDSKDNKWNPGKLCGLNYHDLLFLKNKVDRQEFFEALKPDKLKEEVEN